MRTTRMLRGGVSALALASVAVLVPAPAHAATPPNDKLVQGWYRDFLDRSTVNAAADDGRQHWVQQLDAGRPREEVLGEIVGSHEHAQRRIDASYRAVLGRAPDRGAGYWVDGVTSRGMALEWVDQNLLASQELYDRWGARRDRDDLYVQDLYVHVLGRYAWETTPGERAYWAGRVRAAGRLAAVRELWYSDEAVRHRLVLHYSALLDRDRIDRSGLDYWYPREVRSDLATGVAIAATTEYRDRAVQPLRITYLGPYSEEQPDRALFRTSVGRTTKLVGIGVGEVFGPDEPLSEVRYEGRLTDGGGVRLKVGETLVDLSRDVQTELDY